MNIREEKNTTEEEEEEEEEKLQPQHKHSLSYTPKRTENKPECMGAPSHTLSFPIFPS